MDASTIAQFGAIIAVGGGVVTYVSTNASRIAVIETASKDLKELILTRLNDVDRRLERIERAMNGALKHQ